MYDEYGPAPIDSYDLYAMGLRSARCNGCKFTKLKWELGDKSLVLQSSRWTGVLAALRAGWWAGAFQALRGYRRWTKVYELDQGPIPGQGKPLTHKGRPIRYHASFTSVGHSDECYHWRPPK